MMLWVLVVVLPGMLTGVLAQDYDDTRSQNKWWSDYASLDDYDDDQLDRRMNLIITKNILPGDFPLPIDERLFFRRTSSEENDDDFAPQRPQPPPPRRNRPQQARPVTSPRPTTIRLETPRARVVPQASRRPAFRPLPQRTTLPPPPPPTSAEDADFDSTEEELEERQSVPQQQGRAFNPPASADPLSPNVLSDSQNVFVTQGTESPKVFNAAPNRLPNSVGKRPVRPNNFVVSTPASRPFVPTTPPPRQFNPSPSSQRPFSQSTPRPQGPLVPSQPPRQFSASSSFPPPQRQFSASTPHPPREFAPSATPQFRPTFQSSPPPRPIASSTPVSRPFHPANIAPRPFHANASQPPQLTRFEGFTPVQPSGRPQGPPQLQSVSIVPIARDPTSAQPELQNSVTPPPRRTQVLKRRLRPSSPPPQQDVSFSGELEDDVPRSTHQDLPRVFTPRPHTQPQPSHDVRLTPTLSVSQPSRRPVIIDPSLRPVGSPQPRDQPFRATTFRPSLRPDIPSGDIGRVFLPPQSNQIPQRRRRPVVVTSPRTPTLNPSAQRSPEVEVRGRVRVPLTTANPLQPTLSAGASANTEIIPPAALREVRPRVRTGERTSTRFQRDETRRRNALLAAASSSPAGVAMPDGTVEFVPDVDDLLLLSKLSALQDNSLPKTQQAIRFLVHHNNTAPSRQKTSEAPCDHQGRNFCSFNDRYPTEHVDHFVSEHSAQVKALFEQVRAAQAPPKSADHAESADANSQFVCETQIETVRPGWAKDATTGHWVVVINTQHYPQRLRVESCRRRNEACLFIAPYYRSSCVEHESVQRLVAVHPDHPQDGPQIALVTVPCGCSCRVGTPGQSHSVSLEAQS